MAAPSRVSIRCPETGAWLETGYSLDDLAHAQVGSAGSAVPRCPHCGRAHWWTSRDGVLPAPRLPAPRAGDGARRSAVD